MIRAYDTVVDLAKRMRCDEYDVFIIAIQEAGVPDMTPVDAYANCLYTQYVNTGLIPEWMLWYELDILAGRKPVPIH